MQWWHWILLWVVLSCALGPIAGRYIKGLTLDPPDDNEGA